MTRMDSGSLLRRVIMANVRQTTVKRRPVTDTLVWLVFWAFLFCLWLVTP